MSETVLAVQIAGVSTLRHLKARLALTVRNRLIAPGANRIDRGIAVLPPGKGDKTGHGVTPVDDP